MRDLKLDQAGHLLLHHARSWNSPPLRLNSDGVYQRKVEGVLSAIDLTSKKPVERAILDIDDDAKLVQGFPGQAVLQTPEGVLVLNIETLDQAHAQLFFPHPSGKVTPVLGTIPEPRIYLPAGAHGIHAFRLR